MFGSTDVLIIIIANVKISSDNPMSFYIWWNAIIHLTCLTIRSTCQVIIHLTTVFSYSFLRLYDGHATWMQALGALTNKLLCLYHLLSNQATELSVRPHQDGVWHWLIKVTKSTYRKMTPRTEKHWMNRWSVCVRLKIGAPTTPAETWVSRANFLCIKS